MAHFKRTLTVSLQELAKVVHGVQTIPGIVAALTHTYQIQHAKLAKMVRVLLAANARALGWVPLAHEEYISVRQAVHGVVFRVVPDQQAIDGDYLLCEWLEPFVPEDTPIYIGASAHPCEPHGPDIVSLAGWYAAHAFRHGDHIIVQIDWQSRCELHLRVDRRVAQRIPDTVLLAGDIASQLTADWHATHDIALVQLRLLARYAQAPWRTTYPPMPWQSLLNAQTSAPVVLSRLDVLRLRISELQQQLRNRRMADCRAGLWDGIAQRYSAVRMFIDTQYEDSVMPRVLPVDTLIDHSPAIDDAIARGAYDVHYAESDAEDEWVNHDEDGEEPDSYTAALQSDDDDDDIDDTQWSEEDLDTETFVALFAHRHPALHDWSVQLLRALNDEERRKMLRAETDEDHTAILSAAMQRILPQHPHLMHTLRPMLLSYEDITHGGQSYGAFEFAEVRAAQHVKRLSQSSSADKVDKSLDGDAVFVIELALRESQLHIRAYEEWLSVQSRSGAVRQRIRAMHEWSLFLAQYYTTSIVDASYAMLDEYLFFHYPRHTVSGSARMLRLRVGYIRDFYAYRASLGDTRMLAVAHAMYECRDQAGDVLNLLLRIQQYPRELTALVVHLFAPYTL